jgi:hypothetical protein
MPEEINAGSVTRSLATKDIPAIPGFYEKPKLDDPKPPPSVMLVKDAADGLYDIVRDDFITARDARRTGIEPEWERAWFNQNGEYTPSVKADLDKIDGSKVFVHLTRTKTSAAKALIMQVHAGPGGMQWGMSPTPDPEMADYDVDTFNAAIQIEASKMAPEDAQAFIANSTPEAMLKERQREAEKRMEGMRTEIRDYMVEMNMDSFFVRMLDPYVDYGTAVIQGPVSVPRKPVYWRKDEKGNWSVALSRYSDTPKDNDDIRPEYWLHSPWDVYPDPAAKSQEELSYVVIRHVMSRHQLAKLQDRDNFDARKIRDILDRYPAKGNWYQETWEGIIRANDGSNRDKENQFVVYEWVGYVNGRRLKECEVKGVTDAMLERHCVASIWTLDESVIKAVVDNREPQDIGFIFIPYEPVDGRIWGRGVPAQMADSQDMWNASQRAIMDNMRHSAGPQFVYDQDRIGDTTDPFTSYPGKAWGVKNLDGLNKDPVYMLNPPNNVQQMQSIQQGLRLHIQMETSIPDMATGIPGAQTHNRTEGGMAIQQGMVLSFIRSVIAGMDINGVKKMVSGFYHWAMNYSSKDWIKGDYEVEAKGVMAAMSNEILTAKMERLLQAPWAPEVFKMDRTLGELVKRWGLSDLDVAYTMEEMQANTQRRLAMESEAQSSIERQRVSPIMPKINALVQAFNSIPPGSPAYGPWLENIAKELGILDQRMAASINAINQEAAAKYATNMSQMDVAIMAADLTSEEMQGGIHPAAGSEIQDTPGDVGGAPAGAGPAAPDSRLGLAPPVEIPRE